MPCFCDDLRHLANFPGLALLVAAGVGIVKPDDAFKGFSSDIVLIVAYFWPVA